MGDRFCLSILRPLLVAGLITLLDAIVGNKMRLKTKTAIFLVSFAKISCVLATDMRPISAEYGVCLKEMNEVTVQVNSPVDVEFASLAYKGKFIARFELTILGPDYKIPKTDLGRWMDGEVILVNNGNDYVGIKKYYSGDGYPNVYIYLSMSQNSPYFINKKNLMRALLSCDLKARSSLSPPPELDSIVVKTRLII
jgi:hypothetical protein